MKYSLDKAISMYYNKNTALNVVLYLSHRELIQTAKCLLKNLNIFLYLSHRELIHLMNKILGLYKLVLYLSHRELILKPVHKIQRFLRPLPFP